MTHRRVHMHLVSLLRGQHQGIYLIATYTFCCQSLEHKTSNNTVRTYNSQTPKRRETFCLCSVFRTVILELKKKKRNTETGQQFTYQMNENKNDAAKGGGSLFWWWNCSKTMSHMFKVLLNEERRVTRGSQWWRGGVVEGMRPTLESNSIVAFRHAWRPKRRGDFRAEPEERGLRRWGEEALLGSGFLPGAFEASQISNTALATSLVWNPHFCHRTASAGPL